MPTFVKHDDNTYHLLFIDDIQDSINILTRIVDQFTEAGFTFNKSIQSVQPHRKTYTGLCKDQFVKVIIASHFAGLYMIQITFKYYADAAYHSINSLAQINKMMFSKETQQILIDLAMEYNL